MLGLVLDALPRRSVRVVPIVIYIAMGWLVLLALKPLLEALPYPGFLWLLAGGVAYTTGLVFLRLIVATRGYTVYRICSC